MSDNNFDLSSLTEGMSADEAMSFIKSTLTPEARERFLKAKRDETLGKQYETEIANATKGLSTQQRIRKISEIQAKYRRAGLGV